MRRPKRVADEARGDGERRVTDPILALRGLGKEIWADEDADAYVRRLREGWESESEAAREGVGREHG